MHFVKINNFYGDVKQCHGEKEVTAKMKRAETLLGRKIGKVLTLEDGSTLKIPKFKKLGTGSFAFAMQGWWCCCLKSIKKIR